ncbi:IS1 family transposase [Aeromonas caviae]
MPGKTICFSRSVEMHEKVIGDHFNCLDRLPL